MAAYYNEYDPFMAEWLRGLIAQGQIAPGEVDERSITEVCPDDLKGFTQCHFFAGLGGWSHALRLAGIPDDYPCWTGSPPCQPFSLVGHQRGQDDERHLAPVFLGLIRQQRPAIVFGEQVAPAIAKGWLDDLFTHLEGEGYACGAAVLPAGGVGAPHKRERLFFGAHVLAHANGERLQGRGPDSDSKGRNGPNLQPPGVRSGAGHHGVDPLVGHWAGADWVECSDGKWRPVESGTFPVVNRLPKGLGHGKSSLRAVAGRNSKGRLKGYGNAIVPQVAAEFVMAFMEARHANPGAVG